MQGSGSVDFFISYTRHNEGWAVWLDRVLRQAEYTTVVQVHDFNVGDNFIVNIQNSLTRCRWVACLLSPAYLKSSWCTEEWAAALHGDKMFPIRIAECDPEGLLAGRVYLDLVGRREREAIKRLLAEIEKRDGQSRRAHDNAGYPGTGSSEHTYPGDLPSIWNIPHERNRYFTGRGDILDALHASLNEGRTAALTQAIKGLGGVGKTQLALEYAYRYASEYEAVWWMRAEEPATLAQDYAALAEPLGIDLARDQGQMVREVHRALMHRDRFLLIFDNATNPDSLKPYLPTHPGRRIIVTTRANVWPQAALQKVETLDLPVAVEFLLNRTGKSDKEAAADIAKRLGCLPLALEQAAAYIEACDKSLPDYSKLLARHGLALLEKYHAQDYGRTVGTTWSMAFDQLQSDCPAAVDLMHLCAFLSPDTIYVRDLAKAKEHLPPRLAEMLDNELQLDDAKAALLKYSLIAVESDSIYIHRLVQEVTRNALEQEQREEWLKAALRAVNALFPFDSDDVRTWPTCAQWLPHALTVVNTENAADLDANASARLLNQAGLYLVARADHGAAEPLYRRALEILEQSLGKEHPLVAAAVNNLAVLLRATNRLSEAEPLYRRALGIDERSYGPNHPNVATDLNNLAVLLEATNRLAEAEPLYRRALGIDEKSYGPSHPSVARDLNNLAELLRETNRLSEAEPLYRRALGIDEKSYGPSHPSVASDLNNLAVLLGATNRLSEAEPLYRRALGIDEKSYGPNHPTVAIRLSNLAVLLEATNRLAEAEPLYRRALEIDEKSFGPNHPKVAIRLVNLGSLLRDTGRAVEAEPMLRRALGIFEASLGSDHPNTVTSRGHLDMLLAAKT